MQESAIDQRTRHRGGGGKGAHNRETLQTTGFYVGRIVFVPREFAPIPHAPAGLAIPMAIRMRFLRHDGIYRSDVVQTETNPGAGPVPPPPGRPRAQVKERVGRTTPFSSSAMSSGRLFLDRVGRHQSPSPLHRHDQDNSIARSAGTTYHRTVSSVLTVCLTSRDKCTDGGIVDQAYIDKSAEHWMPVRIA
jgi:hypothetical protein